MRLIDADWLEEHMNLYAFKSRADISLFINDAPTIEPKKGEWVENDGVDYFGFAECSCCKWSANDTLLWVKKDYKFCPNCGADMREGNSK